MSLLFKIFLILTVLLLPLGCAQQKRYSNLPAKPISVLVSHNSAQDKGFFQGVGKVGQGALDGLAWVVKELFSPLDALRKGIINTFGVTSEEPVVVQKNVPPSPFRGNQ